MATSPLRVVSVIGPPASGKGSLCQRLAAEFGFVHISVGDLFRDHVQRETAIGLKAREYIEGGHLVSDNLVFEALTERTQRPDYPTQNGWLLDGLPRTVEQATTISGLLDCLVVLQVDDDDTLVQRVKDRRMDPETGLIFNLRSVPPPAEVLSKLMCRPHDKDEAHFRTRLQKFRGEVDAILSLISCRKEYVDGQSSVDVILREVSERLQVPLAAPLAHTRWSQALVQPMEVDDGDWPDEPEPDTTASGIGLALEVKPCSDVGAGEADSLVMVSVNVPAGEARTITDMCCVVDISGSMGTLAQAEPDATGKSDGLSVLDIVKHAVKTVINMLQDKDRLALVAFDDKAETVFNLGEMTTAGKEAAVQALDALRPRGQTNLWDGILSGMEALRSPASGVQHTEQRQSVLLVLTDGQPNISPPRGELTEFRTYRDSHPGFQFQVNTFGFGYSLNSELLSDLSVVGHGTYAFIPDAVILGTCFVDSVSNVLSTCVQNSKLHLLPRGGASLTSEVLGGHQVTEVSWGRVVSLGPLQFGQSREVIVPLRMLAGTDPYLEVVLEVPSKSSGTSRLAVEASCRISSDKARLSLIRNQVVDVGLSAVKDACGGRGKAAVQAVAVLAGRVAAAAAQSGDKDLDGLKSDVEGRMSKALKGKDRFDRWGKHYLRALMRAHQLQLCTNFMDPGVQVYGGGLFTSLRNQGSEIFRKLPACRPAKDETLMPCDLCGSQVPFADYATHTGSCGRRRTSRPAVAPAPARAPVRTRPRSPSPDMNTYYAGAGGGCFGPQSSVMRVDRDGVLSRAPVRSIRVGDELLVADGTARVRCVVQVARPAEKPLVHFPGGLAITPGHPIRLGSKWVRPRDIVEVDYAVHDGFVYNFILDRGHVLLVDGVQCVTWAHGMGGEVLDHPFFGTREVVQSLSNLQGWHRGFVRVDGVYRCNSGVVVGFRGAQEVDLDVDTNLNNSCGGYVTRAGCPLTFAPPVGIVSQ